MNKRFHLVVIGLVVLTLAFASVAMAAEKELTATIDSSTVAIDKNGAEYVRLIINEQKNLNGIDYTVGLPVMAFSSTLTPAEMEQAKALQAGSQIHAIVSEREYQGRSSYTLLKILP